MWECLVFQRRTGVKEGSSLRRASLGASRVYVFMGGMILGKGRERQRERLCYRLLRTIQVSTGMLLKILHFCFSHPQRKFFEATYRRVG